jgi:hypothetical protein
VRERAFQFGTDQILTGVLTEPDPSVARASAPAVVVSNVGLHSRVGPFRVWVELARSLATLGFSTLRFDLNGLGDSEPRRDARGDLERAAVDLSEALDFLERKRGFRHFAGIGMCSGVDSLHRVATQDPRLVAAAFIEGYAYATRRSSLDRRLARTFTLQGIQAAIRRRLPRHAGSEVGEREEVYVRDYPEPAQLAADLERMLARKARLLYIYAGEYHRYTYPNQFFDMLRPAQFEGRVEVEFFARADHTFRILAQRRRMLAHLGQWMVSQFPV